MLQQVIDMAVAHGATDAMVSVNRSDGFTVDVRMREIEKITFNSDVNINLVVYFDKRKASVSSTDMSLTALEKLVIAACDIAKVSSVDPCFGLADRELMTTEHQDLNLYHPWHIEPTDAIDLALQCENHALELDKRIVNSDGVSVSTHSYDYSYLNTHGGAGNVRGTNHSISCSLVAQNNKGMQRDYDYSTACRAEDLLAPEKLAVNAVERTIKRLGARKIKTETLPVIFSSRVSSNLIHSFINAISGSNLYRKNSFLLDSLHQLIFPEWMNIYEQPRLLMALGSAAFDGEGVATRDNIFVKNGCVEQYVLSSYSARKLNMQTTANSDGVHNLTVTANAKSLDDMVKSMHRGLVITELMGQGVNLLTGDYSRGAYGFMVENGAIQYPVEEITIAGNLKTIFHKIIAIGNDINSNIATRCGSILVSDMMVAGS